MSNYNSSLLNLQLTFILVEVCGNRGFSLLQKLDGTPAGQVRVWHEEGLCAGISLSYIVVCVLFTDGGGHEQVSHFQQSGWKWAGR